MTEINVMVAQAIPQDIAEKVNKELARREYEQRLMGLIEEITRAGFRIDVEWNNYLPNNTFTNRIAILGKSLKS